MELFCRVRLALESSSADLERRGWNEGFSGARVRFSLHGAEDHLGLLAGFLLGFGGRLFCGRGRDGGRVGFESL